jgi:hypothetical protein
VARTASIGIRVEPELKDVIEKAAKADRRTMASLIEKVMVEWLKANGHLPKEESE